MYLQAEKKKGKIFRQYSINFDFNMLLWIIKSIKNFIFNLQFNNIMPKKFKFHKINDII